MSKIEGCALLRKNKSLFSSIPTGDYNIDRMLAIKGTVVYATRLPTTDYRIKIHSYMGYCTAADLDFLDEDT